MRRVVVTGLGFITSIGNSKEEVVRSLKECRTGVEAFDEFSDPSIPIKLAGTIKGFSFPTADFEDWTVPPAYALRREQMRAMAPNSMFAYASMKQAIADAGLTDDLISHERTGLTCASGGSMQMAYANLHILNTKGVQHCPPMSMVNSIPGSLYINLGVLFKIKGGALGLSSACSSSAHAAAIAYDLIRAGRQDRVFVVGAEDVGKWTTLPFASIRALSAQTDATKYPCAFDKKRDGFVGTGGGATLVLEDYESAVKRGAKIYGEIIGWAHTSDGFNVVAPEVNGEGLARCMKLAFEDAGVKSTDIDYINAHATSTAIGDTAEIRAIKTVFTEGRVPNVSSTKSLTGHGLSLAGAMELGFSFLAIDEKFTPVSAHITEIDPECEGIPIVTKPIPDAPRVVMSNSSAFGGSNVSIIIRDLV